MTDYEKKRYEDYKLAHKALMKFYPLEVTDLDGEEWRDIEGFEGFYKISNYGRVKSFHFRKNKVKILIPYVTPNGYLMVSLHKSKIKKKITIHRLVAKAFIPNPENLPAVDHKFGIKFDNYAGNLEWVSYAENSSRAINMGLLKFKGEDNPSAIISNEDAAYCRSVYIRRDKEFGAAALARRFGITKSSMCKIVNGKSYKHIQPIVGTTAVKHIEEAVSALDIKLDDEIIKRLEAPYVPHFKSGAF